jgi:serine/threonine-protein kinase
VQPAEDVSHASPFAATLEVPPEGREIPATPPKAAPRRRGALAEGVVVAERFRLVRELGRGGMGAVWLAEHLGLGVPCAVKFNLAGTAASDEQRRRVEREARAAALLKSPHVVQMLDHGIWNDHSYIAMEHLEGEDLRQRLTRVKRLSSEETVRLVTQVARGLSRAHAASVIHRDLKPDNIFLVADPDGEIAKILDFGIAKAAAGAGGLLTSTTGGVAIGTPAYMSPEQLGGSAPVDHRCDLWALGVITFECLAGMRPFEGPTIGELVMQIMMHPLVKASKLAPDLPPVFDAWWARACARDPERRFQSALELSDALSEALREGSAWRPTEAREPALSPVVREEAAPATASGAADAVAALPAPEAATSPQCSEAETARGSSSSSSPALEALCTTGAMEPPKPKRPSSGVRQVGRVAAAAMVLAFGAMLVIRRAPSPDPQPSATFPSVVLPAASMATASPAAAPPAPAAPTMSTAPEPVLAASTAAAPSKTVTPRPPAKRAPVPVASSAHPSKAPSDAVDPSLFDRRR